MNKEFELGYKHGKLFFYACGLALVIILLSKTWYLHPIELEKRITALEEKCK